MATTHSELSQDAVFDLLSNPRRRFVINYLLREGGPVTIQQLSRELAAWEFDVDPDDLTDQQEKRIYVALYQTHVPKLEEAGVLEYDAEASLVEITDTATQLQSYIDEDAPAERPWPWYYLAVATAGIALFAGVLAGVSVFSAFSLVHAGGVTVAAFVALALFHYFETTV